MTSQHAVSVLHRPIAKNNDDAKNNYQLSKDMQARSRPQSLRRLIRAPKQFENAFDSFKALSAHLEHQFSATLAFVSHRSTTIDSEAVFVFDADGMHHAIERARYFRTTPPLDVAIAEASQPITWEKALAAFHPNSEPTFPGRPSYGSKTLLLIPFSTPDTTVLLGIRTPSTWIWPADHLHVLSTHCIQFLSAHMACFPPQPPTLKRTLSPQEEKVMHYCALGLTDKETAKELQISPHTVRAH
ncbi:MAG: helix-turn-helix transcriptional regulator, partial [Pseudomonadota bacterium]